MTVLPRPVPGVLEPGALRRTAGRSRPDLPPVRGSFAALVGTAALLGTTIQVPRIGPNLVLLEPVLAFVAATGLVHVIRHRPPWLARLTTRTIPWLFLIAFATAGSLFHAGFEGWALTHVAQSVYAFCLFFGAVGYFTWHRRDARAFVLGLAATSVFVVAALVLVDDPRQRAPGLFYHSNYAAHFLTAAWLLIVLYFRQRPARVLATALLAAGIGLTASFGALLMVLAAAAYGMARRVASRPVVALIGIALCGSVWYVSYHPGVIEADEVEVTSTLSAQRFERSSGGRVELWQDAIGALGDAPLGLGPDGLRRTGVLESGKEAHNSYVAYLAERGPLGLLGLLGLGLTMWRLARPGGIARVMVVAFAAGNVVRETLHYRHMWLILALAFVLDETMARPDVSRFLGEDRRG